MFGLLLWSSDGLIKFDPMTNNNLHVKKKPALKVFLRWLDHIKAYQDAVLQTFNLSCVCCFIFNILTLEVGWLHLDML